MSDGIGGTRTILISGAFVFSGVTSFVTLIAAKRFLTDDDFGVFSIFWSLGFFAAAVSSAPVEQELARSVTVQLERERSATREIAAAVSAMVVGSIAVLAASAVAIVVGLISADVGPGVFVALCALVGGEAVAALVRGEAAARRDALALVVEVAAHGFVRAGAAVVAAVVTENLVVVCLAVALGGIVPAAMVPRLLRRRDQTLSTSHVAEPGGREFSMHGVRRLALGTPPRALFAIGTPVLAAIVAGSDETAAIGDVLAALSITSAPVLVAAALQATLIPQFTAWEERGEYAAARTRLIVIISLVVAGTAVGALAAFAVGRPLLEAVFGATPGVGRSALAAMTAGAGMLFLANMLTPASIATHRYTTMTVAWTVGAVALIVAAFGPGAIADSVGRAVLAGAAVVNVVLLWGLWPLFRARQHAATSPSSGRRGDSGA